MVVQDAVADVSRAVARALEERVGHVGLEANVEAALMQSAAERPSRYYDPLALGSLVISIVTLAWTVYQDLTAHKKNARYQDLVTEIQVRLDDASTSSRPEGRDVIVDLSVREILGRRDRRVGPRGHEPLG